jgi:hypothetical protein
MAKKASIGVGETILVEHTVTAVSDDGTITYETSGTPVFGTPVLIKSIVSINGNSIRYVMKDGRPRRRR